MPIGGQSDNPGPCRVMLPLAGGEGEFDMRGVPLLILALWIVQAQPMGTVRPFDPLSLGPVPGMPSCMQGAVLDGDPAKGPSIMVFESPAGCVVPWHWHTPTEHVMIASGRARFDMRGEPPREIGSGGYAKMPSRHVHRFQCLVACRGFVQSSAAFDIHFVDPAGKEIPLSAALAK